MFGEKFAMNTVGFSEVRDDINTMNPTSMLRAQGFLRFLADVLGWFERYPSLEAIKLVAIAKPEVNLEGDVDIRIRHHLNLSIIGADKILPEADARAEYLMEALPYNAIGAGVFELTRAHTCVQRYLQLEQADVSSFHGVLQELAFQMDGAFSRVFVYHDFGLAGA